MIDQDASQRWSRATAKRKKKFASGTFVITANASPNDLATHQQYPREQACDAVENDKQQRLIDEIVTRSHVTVAENFTVTPK